METERFVSVVVPRIAAPETDSAVDEAYGNWDARVEEAKKAGAWSAVVVAAVVVPQFVLMLNGQPKTAQAGHVTWLVALEYESTPPKVVVAAWMRA